VAAHAHRRAAGAAQPHQAAGRRSSPNQQYDTNYGLSESIGPGCVHLGVENIDQGRRHRHPRLRLGGQDRRRAGAEVSRGEVGELAVKGPGVMKCYYKNPEATAEVLKGGWLYTGDMARRTRTASYYLVDRKKDVIITGGENLYPRADRGFPAPLRPVKDVAVIGLPDKRLGEIAAAIIEIKPG
jgi:long-chain acyl-CoA synthetase